MEGLDHFVDFAKSRSILSYWLKYLYSCTLFSPVMNLQSTFPTFTILSKQHNCMKILFRGKQVFN